MINLLKMILYRITQNKLFLCLVIFVPAIVVVASIIYTNNIEYTARIAFVGEENLPHIDNLYVTSVDTEPKKSELVQGKFDAVVKYINGKYVVQTIKGEQLKGSLERILNDGASVKEELKSKEDRGIISNLIGFLTMLLLLIGSMLYKFFYQERSGTDKRIVLSKVGCIRYYLSHPIIVFLVLFIPTWIICVTANLMLKLNLEVSILELTFMLFVLCLLSASFSFFIACIFRTEQNGSLFSSMVIMITSLVSGSFIEVSNSKLNVIISHIFPQRYLLDYAISAEHGESEHIISMIVIIILCICMLVCGGLINRRKMVA